MSQKNELGKGLKALLSNINKEDKKSKPEQSTPEEPMVSSVALIPLHQIIANPDQPRNTFEKEQYKIFFQWILLFQFKKY